MRELYFFYWLLLTSSSIHIWSCVEATPPHNYTTGPFVIQYTPQALPNLRVTKQDKLVWFTPGSLPLTHALHASEVAVNVTQIGGDYTFKRKVIETCGDLEIKEMGTHPPDVGVAYDVFYVRGVLCNVTSVEITLQGVQLGDDIYHLKFNFSILDQSSRFNQLRLLYGCDQGEGFYGFGAQYSQLNMKGSVLPMFLSEQGVGRGLEPVTLLLDAISPGAGGTWYTTYSRVPHYITSEHRSLYLESLEYAEFDLTANDTVSLTVDSRTIAGRVMCGSSPLQLISSYTALVGRLPPLPQWVGQGAVLGLQGGSESVLHTLSMVEKQWGNLSDVVGVWLQDWTGQRNFSGANELPRVGLWWNWEVDDSHYSDWLQLISSLRSKGIRTLTYINPLFSNVSERGTPFHHNYYEEGLERGYFVKRGKDNKVWSGYSNSVLLDISNPQAYQWMRDIIVQNMLSTGVCGWMCDFGESLPLDAAVLHSNHTPAQLHSLYPSLWAQLNADAIKHAQKEVGSGTRDVVCSEDEVVYFMRSGNQFSPAHTRLFWLGDQMVTWDAHDGLATVVIGLLSQGMSGCSLSHSDIGGYTALLKFPLRYIRSKELYLRWCELAAFTTMYRSHLGTLPTNNWQFDSDQDTLQHFFKMAVVFQSWGFYRETLMEEASEKGWPVVRHMMLVFPNHSSVYREELSQQFMVGDALLVAPVVRKGQKSVQVFLPAHTLWQNIWDKKMVVHKGSDDYETFPAPIGQPCVLYNPQSDIARKFIENLKMRKIL